MDAILTAFMAHGPWGVIVAALLWLYVKSQNELRAETAERINDAKTYTTTALALQSKVFECIERQERLYEATRKQIR